MEYHGDWVLDSIGPVIEQKQVPSAVHFVPHLVKCVQFLWGLPFILVIFLGPCL